MKIIKHAVEFEWDKGNIDKNKKHNVADKETEEAFFDKNKVVFHDWKHSIIEQRNTLLGMTKQKKLLNITYTIRNKKIRVITARPVNKKEVSLYEKAT